MKYDNRDNLLADVQSNDVPTLITALEDGIDFVGRLAEVAVQELHNPATNYFVAERLQGLGTVALTPLKNFLAVTESLDERALAAWALLKIGSDAGIPALLAAIESSANYHCLAAANLAQCHITEAAERIITRLRNGDLTDALQINSLLESLKDLNVDLPEDLEKNLTSDESPRLVRLMVQREWPSPFHVSSPHDAPSNLPRVL